MSSKSSNNHGRPKKKIRYASIAKQLAKIKHNNFIVIPSPPTSPSHHNNNNSNINSDNTINTNQVNNNTTSIKGHNEKVVINHDKKVNISLITVECPICLKRFKTDEIERHVASELDDNSNESISINNNNHNNNNNYRKISRNDMLKNSIVEDIDDDYSDELITPIKRTGKRQVDEIDDIVD